MGIPHETKVVSAHRTPDLLFEYASGAEARGIEVIIAGAGGAAHLPGMIASKTVLPVLGVPVESKALKGLDSLLSIAQMPGGIPVGTLAVGKSGAINSALLAAAILGIKYPAIRESLRKFREAQTESRPRSSRSLVSVAIRKRRLPDRAKQVEEIVVTIGILGGGQLGYMLALAGYPLGLRFRFLDPSPEAPVGRIAQRVTADFDDEAALEKFASGLELVTYEFENVPVAATRFLGERVPVFPPPAALEVAQDRLKEKALFRKLGIATTEFAPVHNLKSLDVAVAAIGLPAVLKTCRFGYDGKGQWTLRTATDVAKLKDEIADAFAKGPSINGTHASRDSAPFILERFISFTRELSILGVRARNGDIVFYPLVQNRHHGGILRLSIAPAPSLAPVFSAKRKILLAAF